MQRARAIGGRKFQRAAVAILQQGCNIRGSSDTTVVTLQQGCTNVKGLEFTYQVPIFFPPDG